MDSRNFALAQGLVDSSYVSQARQSRSSREGLVRRLLANRRLPEHGWDDVTINLFLHEIASMDSNNFPGNAGLGEREGRVYSSLVRERNFHLHHGIGRSGDIGAVQPKAAGSSLAVKIAGSLALDASKIAGFSNAKHAAVIPVATGMALMLTMCALREQRKSSRKVIFLRIDQKSCVKSVLTAGFELVLVDSVKDTVVDEVSTDLEKLEILLSEDEYVCVLSTTSCFAPRIPDRIPAISALCAKYDVPHIVNNAYGLQSRRCMNLIQAAATSGRVDIVVQSTDKNFLVPVGGSVLTASSPKLIDAVLKAYPGRASASPSLDVMITLLSMGKQGFSQLLEVRQRTLIHLRETLRSVAEEFGEKVLDTEENEISVAMSLSRAESKGIDVTFIGSKLFSRFVSGARVVPRLNSKSKVCGITFNGGFGAHCADYPVSYITFACALGVTKDEIDVGMSRLRESLSECYKALDGK
uniref:O-phosphoseryl-tRNA(Sec) selenium transferase n=1 Tax=Rhodosorus marinus TaxID=101924 RepID=A0A7S0G372_9RHOD|mmetsp:Transcript_1767/g.2716  ORF Transcript_1767/g.2716 Transcript_1767/m.2716 type:complete len:469 (+) Transcript_1767:441-1847(+)